jgi:glycosyltransferase involved in cell wall biosynthesis
MNKDLQDVGIIIPAYNEEKRIGATLKALKTIEDISDILVIDDGSQDATAEIAFSEGVKTIKLTKNYGKGYALKKGLEMKKNDIVVFLDADLGDSACEVKKLIDPVKNGEADVTIAKIPFNPKKGGIGLVKGLSKFGLYSLTGKKCDSILSGQRCFRRSVLCPYYLDYKRFGVEFGMTVDLLNNNVHILEVDVKMEHRATGKDWRGFYHRAHQFWDISQVILYKHWTRFIRMLSKPSVR